MRADYPVRRLGQATLFSIIVPVYNEHESLHKLFERLTAVIDQLPVRTEVVLVNDGSRDNSLEIMLDFVARDGRFRVVDLSRNFGHQIALTAGYHDARGDVVGVIDADLQDPPEIFGAMLEFWQQGVDVVYGVRTDRPGESIFKLLSAKIFYRLLSRLSDVAIPQDAGDFRLMDRAVIDVINAMPERHRYLRGMVAWAGFRQQAFPYKREQRFAGETKYPFFRMVRLSLDALAAFSTKPLQMMIGVGFFAAVVGFILAAYYVIVRLFAPGSLAPGFSALFVAILLLFGINFLFLGILASYVGRSYANIQGRPVFIVQRVYEDAKQASKAAAPSAEER